MCRRRQRGRWTAICLDTNVLRRRGTLSQGCLEVKVSREEKLGWNSQARAAAEDFRILRDLILDVPVIADDEHAVAATDQLCAAFAVPGHRLRLVVNRAVAEDADVRCVK